MSFFSGFSLQFDLIIVSDKFHVVKWEKERKEKRLSYSLYFQLVLSLAQSISIFFINFEEYFSGCFQLYA